MKGKYIQVITLAIVPFGKQSSRLFEMASGQTVVMWRAECYMGDAFACFLNKEYQIRPSDASGSK